MKPLTLSQRRKLERLTASAFMVRFRWSYAEGASVSIVGTERDGNTLFETVFLSRRGRADVNFRHRLRGPAENHRWLFTTGDPQDALEPSLGL